MALHIGGMIGGGGGNYFSYYGGTDGNILIEITVWAAASRIKAIAVWLSPTNLVRIFGEPTKPAGEGELKTARFEFNSGERVTRLSLWGNGEGKRLGWIYFETSEGRKFDFGMYKSGKQTEYPQNVASGIWVGVTGYAGADVDALGVVFLNPIDSCQLVNIEYPLLRFSGSLGGGTTITPTPDLNKSFNLLNTADRDDQSSTQQLTWQLDDQLSVDNVPHTWSLNKPDLGLLAFFANASISVQARTPVLAVVDNVVGWQLSDSNTNASSLTSTSSISIPWSRNGSLIPSQSLALSAVAYRGDCKKILFKAYVQIRTKGGSTFTYNGHLGYFTGQCYVPVITTE